MEDELTETKKKILILDPDTKTSKVGDITLIEKFIEGVDAKDLRNYVEYMCNQDNANMVVAGSIFNDKTSLIIGLNKNLAEKYDAGELIRKANELAGGQGGGGRKELAQAGGFNFSKREEISKFIREMIS